MILIYANPLVHSVSIVTENVIVNFPHNLDELSDYSIELKLKLR
jgi:hypothetical protein